MSFSGHSRTLADIIQRRGDVLARTEMAKHQALAQGLQGVTGALGDWLRGKQEAKTEQEALKAFFADPSRETLGPLMALNPQVAAAAVRGAQAFQEEEPPEVEMTPEQALGLDIADPQQASAVLGVASELSGQKINDIGVALDIVRAAKPQPEPEKRHRVTTRDPAGVTTEHLVPESEWQEGGYVSHPVPKAAPAAPDPLVAEKRELDVKLARRRLWKAENPEAEIDKQVRNVVPIVRGMIELSQGIITRVGPTQRAAAIERGAEAVFGTDPQFRVYQDFREPLGLALAVAIQGNRPSNRDLDAAIAMVPDPYRDTKESMRIKWSMIAKIFEGRVPGVGGMMGLDMLEGAPPDELPPPPEGYTEF